MLSEAGDFWFYGNENNESLALLCPTKCNLYSAATVVFILQDVQAISP